MIRHQTLASRTWVITGVLLVDLGFLWWTLHANGMLLVLYTSGLWIDYSWGLGWAVTRGIVLYLAFHFRYEKPWATVLMVELVAGVLVSVADIGVYLVTDCECQLPIDGTVARLAVRSVALGVMALRKKDERRKKEEGRKKKEG